MLKFKKDKIKKQKHDSCAIIRDSDRNYVCPGCPLAEAIDDGFGTKYWCQGQDCNCADVDQADCNYFREEEGVPFIDWDSEIDTYKRVHGFS